MMGKTRPGPNRAAADQLERGGGGWAFGSPEYMQMGFFDDLKYLIELELRDNIRISELHENILILDVLTKLVFLPFWPLQWP